MDVEQVGEAKFGYTEGATEIVHKTAPVPNLVLVRLQ